MTNPVLNYAELGSGHPYTTQQQIKIRNSTEGTILLGDKYHSQNIIFIIVLCLVGATK